MNLKPMFRTFVNSELFSRFSLAVIIFSSVLIGLETSDSVMAQYGGMLKVVDRFILSWFVVEIVLRLAVYGKKPHFFFKCPWNVFDFIVVALILFPAVSPALAVFRLFRILRILRLFSAIPDLQVLVGALLKTLPSMVYVGFLLFLIVYVYGVLSTHLFKETDPAHFGNLGLSLLSLFQVITLEGWAEIFRPQFDHWGWVAVLFFLSFIFIGTMILLNLLIGVVLRSMEEVQTSHYEHKKKAVTHGDQTLDEIIRSADMLCGKIKFYKDKKSGINS